MFKAIEHFAQRQAVAVITISLVLAVLSVWVTVERLEFNTSRGDLIAKDLPYSRLFHEYREEFEDFDGMIAVIEGNDPQAMKSAAETLVEQLKTRPEIFTDIFYKIDTDYFKDKGLLYLKMADLKDLGEKIQDHQDFLEKLNRSPGLNQLLQSINSEISTGMVDTLISDFLGEPEEEKEEDDTADLSLLTSLLKGMVAYLKGEERYRSPWKSFFTSEEETLADKGYLVSEDESQMFILITPDESTSGTRQAIQTVRGWIAETKRQFPQVAIGLTGEDVISADEMGTTKVDVRKASAIALAGVAFLFIFVYRGMVHPLMAVFCLVVALAWSMGFTTLTVGHLNILSVVFTTILIGLGIDFGIHILARYREERFSGKGVSAALERTIQGTGRGNFAGAITTAMAFGAMTLTDFVGIAELGWIAAWGILFCMAAMLLLLPALVTVEDRWRNTVYPRVPQIQGSRTRLDRFMNHYYLIIFISVGFTLWAAASLTTLKFDYNLLHLQAKGTEAVQYEMKIIEKANRSTWSAAMITDSLEEAVAKQKQIEALSTVGKVESIVSVLPEQQQEKIQYIKTLSPVLAGLNVAPKNEPVSLPGLIQTMKRIRFKLQGREKEEETDAVREAGQWAQRFLDQARTTNLKLGENRLNRYSEKLLADYREKIADLKKNAHPTPVKVEALPRILKRRFLSENGKYLISIFPNVNIWERDAMERFLSQLRSIDPNVTGNAVHMFESSSLMRDGYISGGVYAMVAILLYILVTFRNLRATLLILLPVIVGALWTVGIMNVIHVQFNLANLVILPLIIGIGVVNGIHIIHRYREEKEKDTSVLSKSTGQAVVLSSLTTMIGFGSLMVADHQGIFSLGLVLTLGVGSCLIASVTFLPALLKLCTVKEWKV